MDYALQVLYVDLSARTARQARLDTEISQRYLGGRGIAAYFLSRNATISALDPQAPLIFAAGALTGSRLPAAGRMIVAAISPLTDTLCSCSVGGTLARELRRAGIDMIMITGRSQSELVLRIEDGAVTFEESTCAASAGLEDIFSGFKGFKGAVAAVGRAAFQGCLYANIMVDSTFSSGRGGLGRVMAAKNLRALAVKGRSRTHVCDSQAEELSRTDIMRLFDAAPAIMGRSGIRNYGTGALVDLIAARRMMPTANFRRTYFEDSRAFCAARIKQSMEPGSYACHGCPIACKKKGLHEIPEYETLSHFGALNENSDLAAIIEANRICNSAGMDTITTAATIACLAEIRAERYTGAALVEKVAGIAEGTDELLPLGSARLAHAMGKPWTSMSVKALEMPAYDPRGAYGMALAYATSTRGACHLRAYPISHEILRKPVATDRFTFAGKARIIKIAEDLNAVVDSIGACKFAFLGASLEEYAKGFAAVTGLAYDTQDLMRIGDHIYTLERWINTQRGFSVKDDSLPERFFTEEGSSGAGIEIRPIDRAAFDEALQRYYRIRACGPDGAPTKRRREELGL
ncbi:MAG: aldehyde ferredoxin oxidoreductase C-terminal domain-containing protein [Syntrophaceae bacterium]